jgi:hypothetical protein
MLFGTGGSLNTAEVVAVPELTGYLVRGVRRDALRIEPARAAP